MSNEQAQSRPRQPRSERFRIGVRSFFVVTLYIGFAFIAERCFGAITLVLSLGIAGAALEKGVRKAYAAKPRSFGDIGAFLGGALGYVCWLYIDNALAIRMKGFPPPDGVLLAGLLAVAAARLLYWCARWVRRCCHGNPGNPGNRGAPY